MCEDSYEPGGISAKEGRTDRSRPPAVQILVYVDVARAMAAGIEFYVSANGVVLSPGNSAPSRSANANPSGSRKVSAHMKTYGT